jgi:hypothetical protein
MLFQPPRSLYTDLPKRFGFEMAHNGPLFICDTKDRSRNKSFTAADTKWFVLQF